MYFVLIYLIMMYPFFKDLKNKKLLILLCIFPMFLSLAFQDAFGTDYYNYIGIFRGYYIFKTSNGLLFKIIIEILNAIFNHPRSLFIFIALIQSVLCYKIILKCYSMDIIEDICLFFFVLITSTGIYLDMFNILRNSVASLFMSLGILFLIEDKQRKYMEYMLIGLGFHPSIVIWNCIIIVKQYLGRKIKKKRIFFILLVCFILNQLQVIQKLALFVYELNFDFKYKFYLISEHMFPYVKGTGIGMIINLVLVIISLKFYDEEEKKFNIFMYNIGYICWSFSFFVASVPILGRLMGPGKLFCTYIFYKILEKTLSRKYYFIGIYIGLYYILCFIRGIVVMLPPIPLPL